MWVGWPLAWTVSFWDLVEAIEKAEPGSIVELPANLSAHSVQAAYRIVELRRQPKPRYDLQADGIY